MKPSGSEGPVSISEASTLTSLAAETPHRPDDSHLQLLKTQSSVQADLMTGDNHTRVPDLTH